MKIYTVERSGVSKGAIVETVTMPTGHTIPVIGVGEEGRGRIRQEIPVRLLLESWREWRTKGVVKVRDVKLVQTRTGDLRFEEVLSGTLEDEYIVVFKGWIGFRGWNKLETCSGTPVPADMILATGQIAQGEAGRMGAGGQWILKVHCGDILKFTVGGRLYGEPGSFVVVFSPDGPVLYPETLYRLGEAYDEQA